MSNVKSFATKTAVKHIASFTDFGAWVNPSLVLANDTTPKGEPKFEVLVKLNHNEAHPLPADLAQAIDSVGARVEFDAVSLVIPNVVNPVIASIAKPRKGLKIEANREERNGLKRPSIGGKCRAIWDECDRIEESTGLVPMPKQLKAFASENGYNENNAVIELYQWRKFMGYSKSRK